jgi:Caspase domain
MTSIISQSDKKFAVLVGINYVGTQSALNGCINDVDNLRSLLIEKFHYLPENIKVLTDDSTTKPTKQNIIDSFALLVNKATNEGFEELWFSYSGHGYYQTDTSNDETDNRDEVICPVDYATSGFINDDYIYSNLVSKIPESASLFSLMDCCHSGTILDLPYIYKTALETNNSHTHLANVCSISGCRDDQTSADAYINSDYEGAMSWSFVNALHSVDYDIDLKGLVERMRGLLAARYTQVPMLAVSSPDDIDRPFLQLVADPVEPVESVKKPVKFTMKTDYWYWESSWNVLSVDTNEYVFESNQKFKSRYETTITTVDLAPGTYKLQNKDTYGDGGITSLVQSGLVTLVRASMTFGRSAEYTFTV